jgi:biotin carboxylase
MTTVVDGCVGRRERRLLIVGASAGQVPAILAAKRLGLRTVVVDRDPAAVGLRLADHPHSIDVVDADAVCELARQYDVVGALTIQSDIGVPTVGAVVDALGLPGAGVKVAAACSHKVIMRRTLAAARVPQPRFRVADSIADALEAAADIGFPCVIKAPASSGSRGVVRADDRAAVPAAFGAASDVAGGAPVLVEEYIEGVEVGAQCMSVGGECRMVLVHDDELSPPPYMIPVAHAYPSSLAADVIARTETAIQRAVEALGVRDGPSNVDVIIDRSGVPRIIEIGVRMGATCLPELTSYHTGVDWVETAVRIAAGESPALTVQHLNRACAAFILEAPVDGAFLGAQPPDWLETPDDLLEWEVTPTVGQRVSRLRKGTDRIGKVVVSGRSGAEALRRARAIRDGFRIKVAPAGAP